MVLKKIKALGEGAAEIPENRASLITVEGYRSKGIYGEIKRHGAFRTHVIDGLGKGGLTSDSPIRIEFDPTRDAGLVFGEGLDGRHVSALKAVFKKNEIAVKDITLTQRQSSSVTPSVG